MTTAMRDEFAMETKAFIKKISNWRTSVWLSPSYGVFMRVRKKDVIQSIRHHQIVMVRCHIVSAGGRTLVRITSMEKVSII